MNFHYYQKNQQDLHSNPASFTFHFRQNQFIFHTDDGVFSKNYIDYGSFVMLNNFTPSSLEAPILDMGAGYGPLGIVISKLYQKEVYMCEVNERAFHLSVKNVEANQVARVHPIYSDLYEGLDESLKFADVVTNPPIRAGKKIVYAIYDGALKRLLKGGALWVVIQKKQGAPSSKEYLTSLFGNCEIVARDKGYYILRCLKLN